MKTTHAVWIIALGSALLGCGGGGGGSSPPPASGGRPPPAPPAPAPTPPPASTGISTAEIVFPWSRSNAVGSTVTVRGTAADPDGVAAVRVNGLSAAVTAAGSSKPAAAQRTTGLNTVLAATAASDVEWSVEVELEPGETDLVVAVEDSTGAATAGVAEATIKYVEVPTLFTSEVGDSRLIGWSTTLTRTGTVTRLVQFDMASRTQTIYSELHDIGIATCFRSHVNEFLYLVGAWDFWHLRRFNLTTRQTSDVADVSSLLTAGPGFSQGPFLIGLVCSSSRQHAYLLATYSENGPWLKSRVVEVELSENGNGNSRVLTETDPNATPLWLAQRMTLSDDVLIALPEINSVEPLTQISLLDGARTELAPTIDVGGISITATQDRVYVATFEGVYEVLLTPPSKRNISVVPPTEPLIFSQANSIGLDLVNDKVIVGDSDLDVLVAVDRVTGERSELLSRKIGAGPPLITPRRLVLTADGDTLYVADDGGNAAERLFEIDLATGDRRAVGQIHEQGVNRSLPGLAIDEENGDAYVSRYDLGSLLRVDLETGEKETIHLGGDEFVQDIVLDAARRRLLVVTGTDVADTDAIVAVDIVTAQRELISRAGERGDGPAFETLASLAMSPDGTTLYAADQGTDRIIRVDIETGNREVFPTACPLGSSQNLQQVLVDAHGNDLLILSDGIFIHDLETSGCTRIPVREPLLAIQLMADGRLLAAGFNAVVQIDRGSGDLVIVSK
jgi:DNA-binding beta-propeller fold protein YncE